MRIACIGEAMIEIATAGTHAQIGVAGDTLNTAIYLKRADPELQVDYITRVGDDPFSDQILRVIADESIGTSQITRTPGTAPGLYAITTDAAGERSFTYWRDSTPARDLFDDHAFDRLASYDALYLSGITLAILPAPVRDALMGYLAQSSAKIIYDSNYRPRLWDSPTAARAATTRMWPIADIALPSLDDEMALFDEAELAATTRLTGLQAKGALKRGAAGPLSIGAPVSQSYPAAAQVIDTTAAGDSFNGAYLAALFSGGSQAQALMAGHLCACRVLGQKGAILAR